jgi:hypothetical protein
MTIQEFLTKVEVEKKVERNGKGWKARCPAHDDRKPSLSVSEGDDGRILLKCFAGCETDAVVSALGLSLADLFPLSNGFHAKKTINPERRIVATYDYYDEDKKLLFQAVRYDPKDFRQRRRDSNGNWIWNLNGVRRVLYRLPELLAADPKATIFVCEGEQDVDRLRERGLVATTNPMGAGQWLDEYSECLRGRETVIPPDNDQAGRDHAQVVARSLHGVAASVKILELPGLPPKGDVSNWLDAGGDAEQLCVLAENAPEWTPTAVTAQQEGEDTKAESKPFVVHCLADVHAEEVVWLWCPYIPLGKLTILEGDPGLGKSWMTCAIATATAQGHGLPGAERTEPRKVLLLSAEDGLSDTIRPRLDALRADVSQIYAVEGALTLDDVGCLRLEAEILEIKPALVIIDPIVAYLGADVDLHRANETRAVMARLARIAERNRIAILGLRHLTKGAGGKAIYRGYGSIDITAAARSVLLVGADPDDEDRRAVVQTKSNLAPKGAAIGYKLTADGFAWTGESDLTAEQILSGVANSEEAEARTEAQEFLREFLRDGEKEFNDVMKNGKENGLSEKTLRRAKKRLGVISRKEGFGNQDASSKGIGLKRYTKWFWRLPEIADDEPAHEDGQAEKVGHLRENHSSKSIYSNVLAEGGQPNLLGHLPAQVGHLRGGQGEDKGVL